MADSKPTKPVVVDQNLLFGVLALQAGFLDATQFADACSAWATRIDTVLADLLVERGWLTEDDRAEVNRLLDRKVRKQTGQAATQRPSPRPSTLGPTGMETAVAMSRSSTPLQTTQPYLDALPASNYRRKSLHATGGMGKIWRAYDANLDREIAIKELRPDMADDHQIRERFLRKAQITGQLAHPGIVPIHLLGHDERGTPYYVMKFVHGGTLDQAINAYHQQPDPLVFRDLLRRFGHVCQTIAFAHSRGVIHRDLKPSNIMYGDFGETLVLDWGLAKQLKLADLATPVPTPTPVDPGLTQVGQILGTPGYLAPEQVLGQAAGPLTDIYALGVILYEILVGRGPYQGTDTLQVMLQIRTAQVTPPSQLRSDIPRGLEAICLKAMAYPPSNRYQMVAALARAVEDWLADELVRSEAALRDSEEQVRLLLDSTAEAIYGVDLKGNCTFCNPACARMLGYPDPHVLLGQHMHKVAHHHRPDGTPYPVEECRIYQAFQEGRGTHVKDEVFWRADGTSFPVEYWSYPVRRGSAVIGSVVTFLDITEQITQERALARSLQTAERAHQAAIDSLANILRQLPGPLDEMLLLTDRLLHTELSAEQRDDLTQMQTATQTLRTLARAPSAATEEIH